MRSATHRGWALAASAAVHAVVLALGLLVSGPEGAPQRGPFRLTSMALAPLPQPQVTTPAKLPRQTSLTATGRVETAWPPVANPLASSIEPVEQPALSEKPASDNTPPPPPPAARGPERSASATADAAYVRMLWSRINARKPAGQDLVGKALVTFVLDGQGRLTAASIAQSSGQILLDKLALRALRDAAPFPPPPDAGALQDGGTSGRRFSVELIFGMP